MKVRVGRVNSRSGTTLLLTFEGFKGRGCASYANSSDGGLASFLLLKALELLRVRPHLLLMYFLIDSSMVQFLGLKTTNTTGRQEHIMPTLTSATLGIETRYSQLLFQACIENKFWQLQSSGELTRRSWEEPSPKYSL